MIATRSKRHALAPRGPRPPRTRRALCSRRGCAILSSMSAFDSAAPTFDRHRALPDGAPEAIRAAVLGAVEAASPRLLDLGAGTGRVGIPFVAAGDDYVGVDLSFGMLSEFKRRATACGRAPCLVR